MSLSPDAIERLGDGALRMPRPKGRDVTLVLEAVRAWPGVVDATVTEAYLAVYFADDAPAHVDPSQLLALDALPQDLPSRRDVDIAVRYDGVDLEEVALMCGMPVSRVIALHAGATYEVLFLGFMPGFAYLGGLPPELEVSRLPSPRTRVPKNAVAIAGRYTGIYPFESPGGWRLIGTALELRLPCEPTPRRGSQATLFDATAGAHLRAGDRVRFRQA